MKQIAKARFRRTKGSSVKRLSSTGRTRVVGFTNTTDKTNRRQGGRPRVKGFVNNPDTGKKSGIARKNFRRRQ